MKVSKKALSLLLSLAIICSLLTICPVTVADATDGYYTIYAINNAGWSKVNVYWWGSDTDCPSDFPGTKMTSVSGTKVYKCDIPNDVSGILFTNGAHSSTKQTGDITSGISDGAIWTIGSASSNNYPCDVAPNYYLVGTMSLWSNNDNYKFSLIANGEGKLEYKLSGVSLSAYDEVKVHSSTESWYPSGNNHNVPSAGVYDVYFRPNGDGNGSDGWLADSSNASKYYVKLVNVTPYTVTWVDGDGNTLKSETVLYGTTPEYEGVTPTKTATAQYSYSFNGTWSPAPTAATEDATYTAQFDSSVNEYTVTWKDGDDTITSRSALYGSSLAYEGATPTKAGNLFVGWDTKSDGTGTRYTDYQSMTIYGHTTLYAVWDTATVDAETSSDKTMLRFVGSVHEEDLDRVETVELLLTYNGNAAAPQVFTTAYTSVINASRTYNATDNVYYFVFRMTGVGEVNGDFTYQLKITYKDETPDKLTRVKGFTFTH